MAIRKSRFDHLLFLQKVNEWPFLFDINDTNYKDMMLKEARWTEIGAVFQMSGQNAQLKWKSLRDRFTREKKKFEDQKRNSEDEVPPPKWWLFTIIAKVLDRSSDSKSLIPNGDGFEERENDAYGQSDKKLYVPNNNNNVGESLSPFGDYHSNNTSNNSHHHHHLRNRRHNNHIDASRSSFEQLDSDSAVQADGDATTASEIASAVHCEVRIDDDDDDDDEESMRATNNNQIQHQHSSYKRKRSHVEDTMTEWTYQLTNCLLQRIVEIYPPNTNGLNPASGGGSAGPTESSNDSPVMDDVEYYVRSLAPRLRRLKAKDRGLVRLKIETALYEIESAGDE
ncbi:hypothetical protein CHUAL_006654 [Chamberlinius hualienensis]